jgi:sugar phosphate permease
MGEAITASNVAISSQTWYRWVILSICYFAYAAAYMGRLGLGPMGTFVRTDLAINRAQFGFFITAISVGFGSMSLVAGWLTDRLGIRKMLVLAQVLVGICFVSIIFAQTYAGCLFVMLLAGMSMGLITPGVMKATILWFPLKERATVIGILSTSLNFGGLITASTLPALAIAYGWRTGFLAMGIFAIAFGIIFLFLYRSHSSETSSAVASAAAKEEALRGRVAPARSGEMLALVKSRELWLLTLASCCLSITEFSVLNFFVIYLKEQVLLAVVTAGFMLGVLDVGGLCGKPLSGLISDRIFQGKRKETFIILAATATIVSAAIAFFTPATPRWLILACSAIFGFAAFGWAGIFFTMLGEQAGKDHIGVVNGVSVGLIVLAYAVGVPVFGHLADKTHTWVWSWVYAVGLGTIATVSIFFVREEMRKI